MRIKILKDTATVGRMLDKGRVLDVQDSLAAALIKSGRAEDAFKVPGPVPKPEKAAPAIPQDARVLDVKVPEPVKQTAAPAKKKAAKKKRAPAKKKATRKPAGKKGKAKK